MLSYIGPAVSISPRECLKNHRFHQSPTSKIAIWANGTGYLYTRLTLLCTVLFNRAYRWFFLSQNALGNLIYIANHRDVFAHMVISLSMFYTPQCRE